MNNSDSLPRTMRLAVSANEIPNESINDQVTFPPRLLVLVANEDTDDLTLTKRIWEMAKPQGLEVVLLAMCADLQKEMQLQRKLVTMSAFIRDETIAANYMIGYGGNWLAWLRDEWQPGDVLVCTSEQYIGYWGRLLSHVLAVELETPVFVLSDVRSSGRPFAKLFSNIIFWLGSAVIAAGFFAIELRVSELPKDWAQTLLLYLFVAVEFVAIWFWNSLF